MVHVPKCLVVVDVVANYKFVGNAEPAVVRFEATALGSALLEERGNFEGRYGHLFSKTSTHSFKLGSKKSMYFTKKRKLEKTLKMGTEACVMLLLGYSPCAFGRNLARAED